MRHHCVCVHTPRIARAGGPPACVPCEEEPGTLWRVGGVASLKFAGSRLKRVRLSRRPTKCPNARTARNAMSRYGMLVLLLLLRPGLWGLGAAAMNAASGDEAYAAGLTPEAVSALRAKLHLWPARR